MSPRTFGVATMLAYRNAIGSALGMIAATATVIIFQSLLGFTWIVAIPVAVLAYVTMPLLWIRYVNSLEQQKPR